MRRLLVALLVAAALIALLAGPASAGVTYYL
jgi:hypothetical protein